MAKKAAVSKSHKPQLTEKQRRFVEYFMGECQGNATQAAKMSGYRGNRKTLEVVGCENLRKPVIKAAIDALRASDPAIMTREERQRFWSEMARDTAYDAKDRLRASELLAKSHCDFIDRSEIHLNKAGSLEEMKTGELMALLKKLQDKG